MTSPRVSGLWPVLGDEGFRLFFPLSAIYAAASPVMWVIALGWDLPLAEQMLPSLWHAHEMLIGAFGAALIGFLTTAIPEWSDTEPLKGRALIVLALLWAVGRLFGFLGWEDLGILGAVADFAWLCALLAYLLHVSCQRRTSQLLAFAFWLLLLIASEVATRWYFAIDDIQRATIAAHQIGLAFLGLLGLSLARISVPVNNLVLDPSEQTSPFRPHPGRRNLAPGLLLMAMTGELVGLSEAISGFLFIAAGAAFMDRVAEGFIGKAFFRAEILMLTGPAALAGIGLMLTGAARLGAPWHDVAGLHLALMGGLGLSVLAVFCIAGRMHCGQPLGLGWRSKAAALCLLSSIAFRALPDLGVNITAIGQTYALAALLWAAAFLLWLVDYWPLLTNPATCGARRC